MNDYQMVEAIAEHLGLHSFDMEDFYPHTNTQQAFILAVDFELDMCLTLHGTIVSKDGLVLCEEFDTNPYRAARTAIVKAVYKLIKELK